MPDEGPFPIYLSLGVYGHWWGVGVIVSKCISHHLNLHLPQSPHAQGHDVCLEVEFIGWHPGTSFDGKVFVKGGQCPQIKCWTSGKLVSNSWEVFGILDVFPGFTWASFGISQASRKLLANRGNPMGILPDATGSPFATGGILMGSHDLPRYIDLTTSANAVLEQC
jgi:hypothetical protein